MYTQATLLDIASIALDNNQPLRTRWHSFKDPQAPPLSHPVKAYELWLN